MICAGLVYLCLGRVGGIYVLQCFVVRCFFLFDVGLAWF